MPDHLGSIWFQTDQYAQLPMGLSLWVFPDTSDRPGPKVKSLHALMSAHVIASTQLPELETLESASPPFPPTAPPHGVLQILLLRGFPICPILPAMLVSRAALLPSGLTSSLIFSGQWQ
ncbi:hypothetical protein VULLAG_LOCUS22450 [Vulpes lagopus]